MMMLSTWHLVRATVRPLCRGGNFVSITSAIFRGVETSVCRVSGVKP
jgi:hypothetical protein